jgi:hypothetical protein
MCILRGGQAHQLKEELGLDHFEGRSWRGLTSSSELATGTESVSSQGIRAAGDAFIVAWSAHVAFTYRDRSDHFDDEPRVVADGTLAMRMQRRWKLIMLLATGCAGPAPPAPPVRSSEKFDAKVLLPLLTTGSIVAIDVAKTKFEWEVEYHQTRARGGAPPSLLGGVADAEGRVNDSSCVVRYRARQSHKAKQSLKAVVALMRKLARALWHVGRGALFDPSKLFDTRRPG